MEHPDQNRLRAVLDTPEAKRLSAMLDRLSADVVQKAAAAAKAGDYAAVEAILKPGLTKEQGHG